MQRITLITLCSLVLWSPMVMGQGAPVDSTRGAKADLAVVPGSTQMVLQVDLAMIRQSKLFQSSIMRHPMYGAFVQRFKMDTGVDLNSAVNVLTVGLIDDGQGDGMFLLFDAPLDTTSVALSGPKSKKRQVKGTDYYILSGGQAITTFKGRTLMGAEKRVRTLLTKKQTPASSLIKRSEARNPGAQVWLFGAPPKGPNAAPFTDIDASLGLGAGLKLDLVLTGEPTALAALAARYKTQTAEFRTNPMLNASVGKIFDKVKVRAAGSRLQLTIDWDESDMAIAQVLMTAIISAQAGGPGAGQPGVPADGVPPLLRRPTPQTKPFKPSVPQGTPIQTKP